MRDTISDDRWLEVLAGRATPVDLAGRQAAELRGYFEAQLAAAAPADSEQEKRVMNLLRARGAFVAPAPAPTSSRSWLEQLQAWWQAPQGHRGMGYGAAAVLAFAVVVAGPQLLPDESGSPDSGMKSIPMQPPEVQPKGLDFGGAVIRAVQPEQEALRLQLRLSAQDLASVLQREGPDWVLRAQVPDAQRASVQALLDGYGATLAADGQLMLRFEKQ